MKKLFRVLSVIAIVLTITYCLVHLPELFGYNKLIINSNYMEPVYSKGSIIYYYETNLQNIHNQDIITYKDGYAIKTSIVVGLNDNGYSVKYGNKEVKILSKAVLGKNLNIVIRYLGLFINFVNSNFIIYFSVVFVIIVTNFILEFRREKKHKKVLEIDE